MSASTGAPAARALALGKPADGQRRGDARRDRGAGGGSGDEQEPASLFVDVVSDDGGHSGGGRGGRGGDEVNSAF